jgi:hypothetical protein
MSDKPIRIQLSRPLEVMGELVPVLELDEPLAKHWWATDKVDGQAKKADALIAALAGIPVACIGELRARDKLAVQEALEGFLASQTSSSAS